MNYLGWFDPGLQERQNIPCSTLLSGPRYYDQPEGKDIVGKLWGINKYAILSACFATSFDVLNISNVHTPRDVFNVAGFWFLPFIGCATAFATVTYIATDIRKKDDKLNYALGALACGPVLHAWRNSFEFTCKSTAFLLFAAMIKKESLQAGYELLPRVNVREVGNYYYDFSIVTDEWPKRPI